MSDLNLAVNTVAGSNIGFSVTGVGACLSSAVTDQELIEASHALADFKSKSGSAFYWAVGDVIVEAQARGENLYVAVCEASGLNKQEAMNCAYVARNIAYNTRRPQIGRKVTWAHHRPVASLKESDQIEILKAAEDELLSVREVEALVAALKALGKVAEPNELEDAEKVPENVAKVDIITLDQVIGFVTRASSEQLIEIETALKAALEKFLSVIDANEINADEILAAVKVD